LAKTYAQFNTVSVTGRVYNAEVVNYNGNEFLSVTLITTLQDDGTEMTVKFTNSNGLKTLQQRGHLPTGRMLTVTGHIVDVTSTYTNKNGEIITLTRPQMKLNNVVVADGALGPKPADKRKVQVTAGQVVKQRATVSETPSLTEEAYAALKENAEVEAFDFAD